MGIVSSIKDFIGVEHEENDFDYEAYEEQAEYEAEDEQPRRSFGGRFQQRREELSSSYDNDITIIKVRKFDDATAIANVLKTRRPVIFDVIEVEKTEEASRVVDFMVGVVYGLDGDIKKVSGGIFIATPKTVKINSDDARKKATAASAMHFDI